jgi:hypothetical protein
VKIIGKTENGFILEASKDDVAGMEGMYSHQRRFEIGDVVDIYELFQKYNSVSIALNDINRLRMSAQNIIDAASWVEEFRNS